MTELYNPALGKGPNDLFRFGGGDDTITIDEKPDFEGDELWFSGGPGTTGFNIYGGGGNDSITGSRAEDTLEGGTGSDTIAGGDGFDTIYGGKANGSEGKDRDTTVNLLYGDSATETISGNGTASDDVIFGGDGASGSSINADLGTVFGNTMFGDYAFLTVDAGFTFVGGADTIFGGNAVRGIGAINDIYGDAHTLNLGTGATYTGGIDTITGGVDSDNSLWGDVSTVNFNTGATFKGGDDEVTGGDLDASVFVPNDLYGDAQKVVFSVGGLLGGETFTGGNDTLTGGDGADNVLRGDVSQLGFFGGDGTFVGGDDWLVGGANGSNTMVGDVESGGAGSTLTGGKDTLISGENSNDTMTGDFGNLVTATTPTGGVDTFVFGLDNGSDTIKDFEDGKDIINLSDTGLTSFAQIAGFIVDSSGSTIIDLGDATGGDAGVNLVTVEGVTEMDATDFDFSPLAIA